MFGTPAGSAAASGFAFGEEAFALEEFAKRTRASGVGEAAQLIKNSCRFSWIFDHLCITVADLATVFDKILESLYTLFQGYLL